MLHHTMSLYKNKKKEKNVRYIQKNPNAPSEEQTVRLSRKVSCHQLFANITPYSASSIKESIAEAETFLCSDKKGIKRYIHSCYSVPVYCNTGSPPSSS